MQTNKNVLQIKIEHVMKQFQHTPEHNYTIIINNRERILTTMASLKVTYYELQKNFHVNKMQTIKNIFETKIEHAMKQFQHTAEHNYATIINNQERVLSTMANL